VANRRTERPRVSLWRFEKKHSYGQMFSRLLNELASREVAVADAVTLEQRFHKLANEWSREVGSISSINDITAHPKYREITRLGWDAVPLMLRDLQTNKRFWFPALYEITKIRPFDSSDAGKSKRMTEAWIAWGKRKGLI
jgi:hypothetical protein